MAWTMDIRVWNYGSGGLQQRYLVEVAEMANPEDLPGDLVEAEAEAEVVPLPGVLDDLAAVDVGGHDDGGDRVAEPLLLVQFLSPQASTASLRDKDDDDLI